MKKTFIYAFLLAGLFSSVATSCKKDDVDITPLEQEIARQKTSLETLQKAHDKAQEDLKAANEKVKALETEKATLTASETQVKEALAKAQAD